MLPLIINLFFSCMTLSSLIKDQRLFNKFRRSLTKKSASKAAKTVNDFKKEASLKIKLKTSTIKKFKLQKAMPSLNTNHSKQVNIKLNTHQEEKQRQEKNIFQLNNKEDISVSARKISRLTITVMLLTFPIVYFITFMPMFVLSKIQIFSTWNNANKTNNNNNSNNFSSQFAIVRFIMYSSNSLNILALFAFGKSFRQDILNLFRKTSSMKPNIAYKSTPCIDRLVKNMTPVIGSQVIALAPLNIQLNEDEKREECIVYELGTISSWSELKMRERRKRSDSFGLGIKNDEVIKEIDKRKKTDKQKKLPSSNTFGTLVKFEITSV